MAVGDEQVALVDGAGRVIGAATRREVRSRNLRHMATGVLVRNSLGLVYVHRRTATKDVYPGRYDCCAGGVVGAGEAPLDAARRELAEELGITGVPLRRLLEGSYADDATRYAAYVYEATWDGPVHHQASEVDWGGWMDLAELTDRLADPAWPFVPDTRALIANWLRERAADRQVITGGWDSEATLVEGRWIDRVPRRPPVEERLRAETRLLPWLAPRLPLAVPVPAVVAEHPLRVRHVSVPGRAGGPYDAASGKAVGEFLRALHQAPVADAVACGVPAGAASVAARDAVLARFRELVLRRLPPRLQSTAAELLAAIASAPHHVLVHGDLGPDHLLVDAGRVSGIIDWTDAHIGDPALDLAWTLCGTPSGFAGAVAEAYGVDDALAERARRWRQLGPWHEVVYGIDTDQPAYVESGLAGIRLRL